MSTRTTPTPASQFPATLPPSADSSATCCPKMAGVPKWHGAPGLSTSNIVQRRVRQQGGHVVEPIAPVPATFGFDDRTNLPVPANRGTDEYWLRGGAPGTSGGPRDMDGSSWIGVGVGSTADVELKFVGHSGTPCIGNVSIVVDDPAKATVTPTSFGAASAKLTITGVAAGEVTITLNCNGAPIGWCHAAVMTPKTANVSVYRINLQDMTGADMTPATPLTAGDIAAMKTELDRVYAQCAVTWNVQSMGVITYTSPQSMTVFNASLAANRVGPTLPERAVLLADIRANNTFATIPVPTAPDINLYYMEAPATYAGFGGFADGVPSTEAIIFATPRTNWDSRLLSHELGHCLTLRHPNDAPAVVSQIPDNFRLPLALDVGGGNLNIPISDHINLMGYGSDAPPMSSLRYDQWKAVQNRL